MKKRGSSHPPKSVKVKLDKRGGSQNVKPTRVTCGKRHYGECLRDTGRFYGCRKEEQKVSDCSNISYRGKDGKKITPSVPKDDSLTKRRFYGGMSLHFSFSDICSFYVGEYG